MNKKEKPQIQTEKLYKLNFLPDQPTVNGRIYPKQVFEDAMRRYIDTCTVPAVYSHVALPENLSISNIVGKIIDMYYDAQDNKVEFLVEHVITPEFEKIKDIIDLSSCKVTTIGHGEFEEDGKTVKNFTVSGLSICLDEEKK